MTRLNSFRYLTHLVDSLVPSFSRTKNDVGNEVAEHTQGTDAYILVCQFMKNP